MNQNLNLISKLLNDFNNFVENRSHVFLVVVDEVFPKILDWHFIIWNKEYELLQEKNQIRDAGKYSEILRSLNSTFKKIEIMSLKEGQSFSFFKKFKEHIEKYQFQFIYNESDKKFYYIKSIIPIFYLTLTENINNSTERYDIWKNYFPSQWKVTKENIGNPDNLISSELFHQFLEWTQRRIWESIQQNNHDEILEEISSNLFPSTDPIIWAKILTFVLRPWTNDNRMLSLVSKKTNFGYVGRVFSGFVDSDDNLTNTWAKQQKSRQEDTLKLAIYLFKDHFTKEKLTKFIEDLEKLEFESESNEEIRRKEYLRIFQAMMTIIDSEKLHL